MRHRDTYAVKWHEKYILSQIPDYSKQRPMTPDECGRLLGYSANYVRHTLINLPNFPAIKLKGNILIRKDKLREWLEGDPVGVEWKRKQDWLGRGNRIVNWED